MRIYLNHETDDTTFDYGLACQWAVGGAVVSEYQKLTEFGGDE